MENGEQRNFHIRNEAKEVMAKITFMKEFNKYVSVIFVDTHPALVEFEAFNEDHELNKTIRTLIFKTGISDIMDIKEVNSKGEKIS